MTVRALIEAVNEHAQEQGFAVVKRRSKQRKGAVCTVYLRCDRGGTRRQRQPLRDPKRHRHTSTRMVNCPFEAVARLRGGEWILDVKKPEHNHEASSIMSHPTLRKNALTPAVSDYIETET